MDFIRLMLITQITVMLYIDIKLSLIHCSSGNDAVDKK